MLKESFDPKRLQVNLQAIPAPEDLYFFVLELASNKCKIIEVSWARSDGLAHFRLVIIAGRGIDNIKWQLWSGLEPNIKLLWEQNSKDIRYVHNLIIKSCGALKVTVSKINESGFQDLERSLHQMTTYQHKAYEGVSVKPDVIAGVTSFISLLELIQNIYKAKNTGRLVVTADNDQYEVYFIEGVLTHCNLANNSGIDVFYSLLEINDCKFELEINISNCPRTMSVDMDELFLNSASIISESRYLKDIGVDLNSVLVQVNSKLTKNEFVSLLSQYNKDELFVFKAFYRQVDGILSVSEIITTLQLNKSKWIPVISTLFKQGLISQLCLSTSKNSGSTKIKPLDRSLIQSVMMILKRADTQIYTYPAFMYFLDQEYLRSQRANCPFSVVILSFYQKVQESSQINIKGVDREELIKRVESGIRKTDYFTHYENNDFALILPNTHTHGAKILINRLVNKILIYPLSSNINSQNLVIACGIVCAPYDIKDIHLLLPAVENARDFALQNGSRVISYQDIIDKI